ncbi:hypothetical protein GN244_ATG01218 [Phytophthora infestans]|uniref:Uncharacterized protein n=1 Tax=Phytophthora infestans TaxID=4787 RepID=A0A833WMS3_PHYIN|nr:hypothetical protein GN244_ATG01218 [Phytophthora infestans]KAF4145409.1 hypothetical protein GN958_ATG05439 [Phytophthora infestans]
MAATINRIQSALCHAAVAKSDDCHLMPQHTTLCVIKNDLFNKYSEMLAELTEDGETCNDVLKSFSKSLKISNILKTTART